MQVSVISTPSASNAAMARRSRVEHPGLLLELRGVREIGAARIGDGRNANGALLGRQRRPAFQPFDAGSAERFRVGHDVSLADRNEILRAEIIADLDLMLDRPLPQRTELARAHRFFFVVQPHGDGFIAPPRRRP